MDSSTGFVVNKHNCDEYDSYLCNQILVSAFATGMATSEAIGYEEGQAGPTLFDEFGFPVWIYETALEITLPHDGY